VSFNTKSHPRKHRILIVDDHPIVRRGLRELVADESDFEICGEAEDVAEALVLVDSVCPDIIVVDLSLKDSHGIELIETIKARCEEVKMLVSSMHDELLFAERTIRAGASGYVSKKELPERIIDAMRQILRGEIYVSPRVATRLRLQNRSRRASEDDPVGSLSNRELAVFDLLGQGLSIKQIAHRLDLSQKTIETYRENVKMKLNLRNSSELSRYATRWVLENS
jgi:DNA-binding NarL/FixJ family response regulator